MDEQERLYNQLKAKYRLQGIDLPPYDGSVSEPKEIKIEIERIEERVSEHGTHRHFAIIDGIKYAHRLDGPAVEYENGTKEWWVNGLLHREDGPAIEYSKEASEYFDGGEEWWQNGKMHRVDGPALINRFKTEYWVGGNLHRADGPAIIRTQKLAKGTYFTANRPWLDPKHESGPEDIDLTQPPPPTNTRFVNTSNLSSRGGFYTLYGIYSVVTDGIAEKEWWVNGKRHRWEGPAVVYFGPDVYFCPEREEYWVDGNRVDQLKEVLERCQIEGDPENWTEGEIMILRLALTEDLAKASKR
jgi:hypothetical protein